MKKTDRRSFILQCSFACLGCATMLSPPLMKANNKADLFIDKEKTTDPKKLNYCGYTCPEECKVYEASIQNNLELKKEAFKLWKIEERYGIKFDAENFYCFQCKDTIAPKGIIQNQCTVRECVIKKGLDCCIECNELKSCQEDLWGRFPEFYKNIIKMQENYKKNTA
jgi:hypothetical protein